MSGDQYVGADKMIRVDQVEDVPAAVEEAKRRRAAPPPAEVIPALEIRRRDRPASRELGEVYELVDGAMYGIFARAKDAFLRGDAVYLRWLFGELVRVSAGPPAGKEAR